MTNATLPMVHRRSAQIQSALAAAAVAAIWSCTCVANDGGSSLRPQFDAIDREVDSLGDVTASSRRLIGAIPPNMVAVDVKLPSGCRYIATRSTPDGCELSTSPELGSRVMARVVFADGQLLWRWQRTPASPIRDALREFDEVADRIQVEIALRGAPAIVVPLRRVGERPSSVAPKPEAGPDDSESASPKLSGARLSSDAPRLETEPDDSEPASPGASADALVRDALKLVRGGIGREAQAFSAARSKRIAEWNAGADERRKQRNREQRHEERHGYWNRTGPPLRRGDGRSSSRFDERLGDPHAGRREDARNFNPGPTWSEQLDAERSAERRSDSLAGVRDLITPGSRLDHPLIREFVESSRMSMSDARIRRALELLDRELATRAASGL
jgi:hypothetical protein